MKKRTSLTDKISVVFDSYLGEKKAYFIKGLCFFGIGLVVTMAYLALLSLAEGTKYSLTEIAITQTKTSDFWYKVVIGLLLGSSGVVVMFLRKFPWVEKNPGWFTFVTASISIIFGIVGLTNELGFLSVVSNTVVVVLIIGYFSKPAYDNWKEIKTFNRKMTKEYGRGVGAEMMPWYEDHN